jgi:2-polyprenyl-3-methyl-5-hydroxy-6-metoxy-1,4-benzoquinol methylase
MVTCRACGLLFVDVRRRGAQVAEYYREEYIPDDGFTQMQMVAYRQQSLAREAARLRQLRPRGGRLLDVGTASGTFLHEFAGHAHWEVEGVEPARVAANFARKRYQLKVHHGFLAEQQFTDETFDVITSLVRSCCIRILMLTLARCTAF